ncbi:hypothetical protein HDC92_004333 [Pedobacter sp. AK017]|uniref:hypothetical protein n=1 Tax=Pedobacter sp. AK017 TaxID=2723073 RepID=UPI00160CB62C|nr:hypothetical protein [Pedobacter sp. AK017]MBB5440630.1 hypothetical protein [Pedobacter sp. AK017]
MREKHHVSIPIWLFIVAAGLIFGICTYLIYKETVPAPYAYTPPPVTEDAADEEAAPDPEPEKFGVSQKAIFDFTGDTVLILGKCSDYPYLEEDFWKVMYKNEFDEFVKADLPEEALIPLPADTIKKD